MTHIVGTVQPVAQPVVIGPDSGLPPNSPNTWTFDLDPGIPPGGGIKFVIVHLLNLNLPANNRVEIDLGYDTDVLTATADFDFWSRPVNLAAFANHRIPIRYITNGASAGGVTLDRFGRGEEHVGDNDITSNSNCDPFLLDANYVEPTFATRLFCSAPPDFENADCATAGDVRKTVAPSVGMILHVDLAADGTTEIVSSASATLVGADLVLTTAQNLTLIPAQLQSSAVIFNYATTCAGARPANYVGRFHKVKRVVKLGLFGAVDYALLQLDVPAAGLGIAPVAMRPDLPAPGEPIFCVHHPEGAVKRLSASHATFKTVIASDANAIVADLDIATGSNGAGLFDASGRVVGVLRGGIACSIEFFPTASALADIGNPQEEPQFRDVMIVLDRSGSMALDGGAGRPKIDEARDAASLFVQLVQSDGANQIGLVSFSTAASSPADFALQPVNDANKQSLTGPAPFTGGIVGGIVTSGTTSIGSGLEAARDQMPQPGSLRTILLLTDGLQNTPPLIEDVSGLDGIDINAIGFGAASSLNGALLTQLSESHNGLYVRADDGLDLKKYFALAFGNIFAAGALLDPEGRLAASETTGKPIRFNVHGEKVITIVVGWDKVDNTLAINLKTPGGGTITAPARGVEDKTGRTWAFLRVRLPHGGERNGTWTVTVSRAKNPLERPLTLHYFVNVIASGGAKVTRWPGRDRYFTGDVVNPAVRLAAIDIAPKKAKVSLTVTRPTASVGTLLVKAKKAQPPAAQSGDMLPGRIATMLALEKSSRKPLIEYSDQRFDLSNDPAQTNHPARSSGVYGAMLKDFLNVEGTYTFHAVVTYGDGKNIGTRELQWSAEVEVGVDQDNSDIKITTGPTQPDKTRPVTVTVIPRDSFGNHVGPGRPDGFTITGTSGTTLTGALRDNGDGSYTVAGNLAAGVKKPGVVLTRPVRCICRAPGRPGVRPAKR